MIDPKDIELVRESLDMARQAGAEKARATLCRSEEDLVATLNGEVDRVTHCVDSSLSFALFAVSVLFYPKYLNRPKQPTSELY